MIPEETTNKRNGTWVVLGIVISWFTFWVFLLSPFGLLAWLGILIYLIIKKTKLLWYFILSAWIFVPSCSFLNGAVQYVRGTAHLQSVGGPETFHGIDRETRVVSTSSGCIFIGYEPFVFPANNTAVRLCTNLFGFQRGAYTGIFPTETEAREKVQSGDTAIVQRINGFFEFNMPGYDIKIDTSDFYRYRHSPKWLDSVVCKTIENDCLVFRELHSDELMGRVYVVDISKNKVLKMYSFY